MKTEKKKYTYEYKMVFLSPTTHKKLKIIKAKESKSFDKVVDNLIELYLEYQNN